MTVSIPSLCKTCLEAGVLILILNLILVVRKPFRTVRAEIIAFLLAVVMIRLCFPVELFYAIPLHVPAVMNPLVRLLDVRIWSEMTVTECLLMLWLTGIVVKAVIYIRNCRLMESVSAGIRKTARKTSVREILHNRSLPDYPVYVTSCLNAPCVLGKNRSIFLPVTSFTREQLDSILRHEVRHLENHDFLRKQMIEVIIIVYCWFPPVYLLRRHVFLYTEVMADGEATWNQEESERMVYARSLVEVQKQLTTGTEIPNSESALSLYLKPADRSALTWRIDLLCDRTFLRTSGGFSLILLTVLTLLSSFVILMPQFEPPVAEYSWTGEQLAESGQLISHRDGTWSLIMEGETCEVHNPCSELLTGVPVIYE
ncbi:M56 family metallopeptidase [uncultured Faecalibaculum sp.]|uniref:M56 family metallopeptidase n=1 Tax=uncultured Faecalibaculum sp. TaxID=1729681 RepID=UPI00262C4274|nr:M56 family metallopeptidase [uncultured Faecalibaculum sp.]